MNKRLLAITLVLFAAPSFVSAEEITITVKGMVCSFCAQGIKKQFSAIPGVESVKPNLEANEVRVTTKPATELTDEKIKTVIQDAGYDVQSIERSDS